MFYGRERLSIKGPPQKSFTNKVKLCNYVEIPKARITQRNSQVCKSIGCWRSYRYFHIVGVESTPVIEW